MSTFDHDKHPQMQILVKFLARTIFCISRISLFEAKSQPSYMESVENPSNLNVKILIVVWFFTKCLSEMVAIIIRQFAAKVFEHMKRCFCKKRCMLLSCFLTNQPFLILLKVCNVTVVSST